MMTLGTIEESAFAYKVVDLGDVCYGSSADVFDHSTGTSAAEGKAAMISVRNPDSKGPETTTLRFTPPLIAGAYSRVNPHL